LRVEGEHSDTTAAEAGAADGDDETLEEAVKGIATGFVGKLKEVAGELLEDEDLERRGMEQQQDAEALRSGGEN
jgi:uncharacterized protein YjbJ (UPF0337 family)